MIFLSKNRLNRAYQATALSTCLLFEGLAFDMTFAKVLNNKIFIVKKTV